MDVVGIVGELLTSSGPLAGLAGFAIWILNRVWSDRLNEERQHGEQIKCLYDQTLEALRANTAAMTALVKELEK